MSRLDVKESVGMRLKKRVFELDEIIAMKDKPFFQIHNSNENSYGMKFHNIAFLHGGQMYEPVFKFQNKEICFANVGPNTKYGKQHLTYSEETKLTQVLHILEQKYRRLCKQLNENAKVFSFVWNPDNGLPPQYKISIKNNTEMRGEGDKVVKYGSVTSALCECAPIISHKDGLSFSVYFLYLAHKKQENKVYNKYKNECSDIKVTVMDDEVKE